MRDNCPGCYDTDLCTAHGGDVLIRLSFDEVRYQFEQSRISEAAYVAYQYLWSQTSAGVGAPDYIRRPPVDPDVQAWVRRMREAYVVASVVRCGVLW